MSKGLVVILEDDAQLANAMTQAFEKEGLEVYTSSNPMEVRNFLSHNSVSILFVDCLLPSESGVDFVASMRKQYPPEVLDVVMMSGIFTDNAFIKDAVRMTKAKAFLKKPFELSAALKEIKFKKSEVVSGTRIEPVEVSPRMVLYSLFSKSKVSNREKRKAIEALDVIDGFDLPYLYSLLAETRASGHLNIFDADENVSGVSFSQGSIVGVDIADQETYLGKLLIESGYALPEDIDLVMNQTSKRRIGEKLIQANLLSPHAFQIVLANQMSIRLSTTVREGNFRVNFVPTEIELSPPYIDSASLSNFLHDWIASKISVSWLKAHYMQWLEYEVTRSPSFVESHAIMRFPLISSFPGIVDLFLQGSTLAEILDGKNYPQPNIYKALHLLLTKGLVVFTSKHQISDEDRLKNLNNILEQFRDRNNFEIYETIVRIVGGVKSDAKKVSIDFQNLLGPRPYEEDQELLAAYNEVTRIANEALQLMESDSKERLREELAKNDLEKKIKAASLIDEVKDALSKGQYAQASRGFEKAIQLDSKIQKHQLYSAWIKLGMIESASNRASHLRDVELAMMEIPPEDRFDALYWLVMGLFYKAKGDLVAAKKAFEKTVNMDSGMIVARRELNALLVAQSQKKDFANRDIKDIVAGLFKKK